VDAAGEEVLVRLLALPVLALALLGSGAAVEPAAPESVAAKAAETTLSAGTARFVVSNPRDSGAINLGNETAVSDRGWISGTHAFYQPLVRREAAVLGIAGKRWLAQTGSGYQLVDDPFLTGTRSLFDVIARAERVQALGSGMERGVPVQRYAANVPLGAFVAALPPFVKETLPAAKPIDDAGPTSWRDYLVNYRGADPDGQRIELAVDAQDRIRRVRIDLFEPTSVELYDYGVRVDASVPPATQVMSSSAYEELKSRFCSSPRRQTLPRPYPCQ
jgi:hypothetical protein